MTDQRNFGRQPNPELEQAWDDYKVKMKAIGKSLTIKQWVIGLLAIGAGIHILVQSNDAGAKAAAAAAMPTASASASVQPDRLLKPKCVATLRDYNAAAVGMAEREVAAIIGCPGIEITRVSYDGTDSVLVSWPGSGGLFSSMDATFDGDRLVSKGQMGLE